MRLIQQWQQKTVVQAPEEIPYKMETIMSVAALWLVTVRGAINPDNVK